MVIERTLTITFSLFPGEWRGKAGKGVSERVGPDVACPASRGASRQGVMAAVGQNRGVATELVSLFVYQLYKDVSG